MHARNKWVQPVVLGLSDGILNALILATPALFGEGSERITFGLALRVSAVALLTALFTVFIAEYAHLRFNLVQLERDLNITQAGQLAATKLGRASLKNASMAAWQACAASFAGSLAPLLIGAAMPGLPWLALLTALAMLAVLGAILASGIASRPAVWAIALALSGAVIAFIGSRLRLT